MNLHEIRLPEPGAYLWFSLIGGNGARPGGEDGPLDHLFLVKRGTPPPIDPINHPWDWAPRKYWSPYPTNWGDDRPWKTALCGLPNLRTKARRQRTETATHWNPRPCLNCTTIAQTRGHLYGNIHAIRQQDPWNTIPIDNRNTTIDPVSGI